MTEFIDAYCQSVNEVSLSVKRVYTCVSLSLSRSTFATYPKVFNAEQESGVSHGGGEALA